MLIPTFCPACGAVGSVPCEPCAASIEPCGPPLSVDGIDRVVAAMSYAGAGRDLVVALKFRNTRCVAPWLGHAIALRVQHDVLAVSPGLTFDLVTWVPAARANRRRRGFDQGALLAGAVGRRLGQRATRTLVRRGAQSQTGANRVDRLDGPTFAMCRSARVGGTSVLLIDDVLTTGASLRSAALALRLAGATTIHAAVAAHTPGDLYPKWSAQPVSDQSIRTQSGELPTTLR